MKRFKFALKYAGIFSVVMSLVMLVIFFIITTTTSLAEKFGYYGAIPYALAWLFIGFTLLIDRLTDDAGELK